MKALASPGRHDRHFPPLPKLTMGRTRTRSRNDSGCDEGWDTPDWTSCLLEETVHTWVARLEGVVRQEVERVREVTEHAKGELKTGIEDEEKREMALIEWRRQVLEIMELMTDLVECVNNDTKEVICDTVGRCSSGHATSSPLDEIEEDDEEKKKNEEIMKLFLLSTMDEKRAEKDVRKRKRTQPKMTMMKEFVTMYKKGGKMFKKSRKSGKNVQEAWTKLKKEEVIQKRRKSQDKRISTSDIFEDAMYGMKMFKSVFDSEDIFEEWNWNLEEVLICEEYFEDWRWNFEVEDTYEDIFEDWKWNMDIKDELKNKFYDTSGVHEDWNDWKFWSFVERSMAEVHNDDEMFGATIKIQADEWKNWHYWDNWGANEEILKALEETADAEIGDEPNFWEDSTNNNNIVNALIDDIDTGNLADIEDEGEVKKGNWQDWQFWDKTGTNEDILKELIEFSDMCDDGLDVYEDPHCFWENNEANKNIISDLVVDENKDCWVNWDFWNDFGQTAEILKAYEEVINANKESSPLKLSELCLKMVSSPSMEEFFGDWNKNFEEEIVAKTRKRKKPQEDIETIFWQISLENEGSNGRHRRLSEEIQNLPVWDSPDVFSDYSELFESRVKYFNPYQKPKDPVNIFKSWRRIFDEPSEEKVKKTTKFENNEACLLDDMEDVYAEWASVALCDDRTEKKRQARGMKKEKTPQSINNMGVQRKKSTKEGEIRRKNNRPGTPTNTTVAIKPSCMEIFEYKLDHQDYTNNPKKEKKTVHVWKNARSRNRLQVKLYAKQPRSRM